MLPVLVDLDPMTVLIVPDYVVIAVVFYEVTEMVVLLFDPFFLICLRFLRLIRNLLFFILVLGKQVAFRVLGV